MSQTQLIRWCGLAAALAGGLYFLAALIHPAGEDAAAVLTPAWVPAHLLGAAAALLMLFGFVGLYARQVERAGWLGLVGFVLVFLGSALLFAEEYQAAAAGPALAIQAPALLDASALSGPALVFGVLFLAGFSLGFLLFGIASIRAQVLPRGSGVLLLLGLAATFGSPLAHIVGVLAAGLLGLGLLWMGGALWLEKPVSA